MKRVLIIISFVIMSIYILSGCKGHGNPYLRLSDLVIRVMEEQGISHCHITYLPDYKNYEVQIEISEDGTREEALESGIKNTVIDWLDKAEFELDEAEVLAFSGGEDMIKRYLVVGVMGYRKWKNTVPDSILSESNLLRAYELYEEELVSSFITWIGSKEDYSSQTISEKIFGYNYYESMLDKPVVCSLQDEFTQYKNNQIYFTVDNDSKMYINAKEKFNNCLVFEITVSNPSFYPSVMYLINNGEIYHDASFHEFSNDNDLSFLCGYVIFEGINIDDLNETACIVIEGIQEDKNH